MRKRVRDPGAKRIALLDAGMHLADHYGLSNVSVNDVAAEAEVGKGSFYVHFNDRSALILELHRGFHENLLAEVRARSTGMAPGASRLDVATTAFLDFCLRRRTVRALLLDIRGELQIAEEIDARVSQITRLFEQDLRAAGWPDAASAARLYMAMCVETAVAELSRARRDAALRRSLRHFAGLDSAAQKSARR